MKELISKEAVAYEKIGVAYRLKPVNERLCPYDALEVKDQANFNITKYLREIVNILTARGVAIYENTRIIDVFGDAQTVAVTSGNKRILANKIIVCNHYPVYKKFNFFFTKMIPYYSYSVIAAEGGAGIEDANYINTTSPTIALRYVTHEGKRKLNISGASHEAYQFKQPLSEINRLKKFGKDKFGIPIINTAGSPRITRQPTSSRSEKSRTIFTSRLPSINGNGGRGGRDDD